MNDRWDDAVPNKLQRAVEDARATKHASERAAAIAASRGTIHKSDPNTRVIRRIRAVSRQACG